MCDQAEFEKAMGKPFFCVGEGGGCGGRWGGGVRGKDQDEI